MTSQLRRQFSMHMRHQNGATYSYHLVDDTGRVVGAQSDFTPRGKRGGKARTVYTLFNPEFVTEVAAELLAEWKRRQEEKPAA